MRIRITSILLVLSFIAIPVFGQISLEWEMLPQTDGDDLTVPFDKTNVKVHDFRINLGLPIVLSTTEIDGEQTPSLVLSNSLFYSNKHLDVNNWGVYSLNAAQQYDLELKDTYDRLISFGYSATLLKTISPKWSVLGIGGFTYAAINPDKFKMENMGIVAGLAGLHSWNSGWTVGFGLYYGRLTGADQLLPILIVQWETEQNTLDITLPSGITYWHKFNQKVSVGLLAELTGDMYSDVGQKIDQYDKAGQLESDGNNIGLAYSSVTFGPAAKISLMEGVAVILRTGIAFARRYQYWIPEKQEVLRYQASPDYVNLTGHDYSGENVEFPIKSSGFIKITFGLGI